MQHVLFVPLINGEGGGRRSIRCTSPSTAPVAPLQQRRGLRQGNNRWGNHRQRAATDDVARATLVRLSLAQMCHSFLLHVCIPDEGSFETDKFLIVNPTDRRPVLTSRESHP